MNPGLPPAAGPAPSSPPVTSRRSFLLRSLGLGLGLGAVALPWAASRGYALPEGIDPSQLRVLSVKEAVIFLAVARRVLRGAPFDAEEEAVFVPWVDAYLGRQAAPLRQEVRGLLWAFEHAPPFLGFGVPL